MAITVEAGEYLSFLMASGPFPLLLVDGGWQLQVKNLFIPVCSKLCVSATYSHSAIYAFATVSVCGVKVS